MTKEVRPPKGALVAGGPPRQQDYPLQGSPTATFTKDLPAPGGNGSWAPEKDQTLRPPVLHSEGTGDACHCLQSQKSLLSLLSGGNNQRQRKGTGVLPGKQVPCPGWLPVRCTPNLSKEHRHCSESLMQPLNSNLKYIFWAHTRSNALCSRLRDAEMVRLTPLCVSEFIYLTVNSASASCL